LKRIHLYFKELPRKDRFFPGDRHLITFIKNLTSKKRVPSGVRKVFDNLRESFDLLKVDYDINLPFNKIQLGEPVIMLGSGRYVLEGYNKSNPVIAGIGLISHPAEWPTMCDEYPVAKYLQHCEWARDIYVPYYGADKCDMWFAGIDTERWASDQKQDKKFDILVYNKIRWENHHDEDILLRSSVLKKLEIAGLSYNEVIYGQYQEAEYHALLLQSKAMIFLCEHESQGFALLEALSMNVPVFAWDQGFWLDPNRFAWGEQKPVPATSVPFFDGSCGMKFKDVLGFEKQFDTFWDRVKSNDFKPREYILENLTFEKSARRMLDIIDSVYK